MNPINIPKTPLGEKLVEAAHIKRQMFELLRQLEQDAVGKPIKKPGAWRHHPAEFLRSQ